MSTVDAIVTIVGLLLLLWLAYTLGHINGYSQAKWEEFNR